MTEVGWIKIHRSMLKWEWYDDANTFRLWIHILLNANFEEKKWHGEVIKPGQLITSLNNLAKQAGLTLQQTRTSLDRLKSTYEITCSSPANYTIITVCNWSKYQEDNTQNNIPVTYDQHSDNIRLTTTKEGKKERKKEKDTTPTPSKGEDELFSKDEIPQVLKLPVWLPPAAWQEYKSHRQTTKPKLTDLAEKKALDQLIELQRAGNDPLKVINQTIVNGWKGFFPLDKNPKAQQQPQKEQSQNYRANARTV